MYINQVKIWTQKFEKYNFAVKGGENLKGGENRVRGDLKKICHNSPLQYVISPLNLAVKLHILAVNCGEFLFDQRLL